MDFPRLTAAARPGWAENGSATWEFDGSAGTAGGIYVGPGERAEKVRRRAYRKGGDGVAAAKLPYAELRAASAFSFLDGASLPEDLIERAAELELPAVALVDRNGVYGAPRFYQAAKQAGVRALVGAEVAMSRLDRDPRRDSASEAESPRPLPDPFVRRRPAWRCLASRPRREPHRLPQPLPAAHRGGARPAQGRGPRDLGRSSPRTPRGCGA